MEVQSKSGRRQADATNAKEEARAAQKARREAEAENILQELETMSANLPTDLDSGLRLLVMGNASVSLMLFQDNSRANHDQVTRMRRLLDGSSSESTVPNFPASEGRGFSRHLKGDLPDD